MRKPDPVEILAVGIPVLLEAVCAVVFIGCAAMLVVIFAMPVPV